MERTRSKGLLEALKERTAPLPIYGAGLEGKIIGYSMLYDVSVVFEHPEGPLTWGSDYPLNWEYYDIDLTGDYDRDRQTILGYIDADDVPWAEQDSTGAQIPRPDCEANMRGWLSSKYDFDADPGQIDGWFGGTSQYAPGLLILDALGEKVTKMEWVAGWSWVVQDARSWGWEIIRVESQALQSGFTLQKTDLGGPASSVPAVEFTGSVAVLNAFLELAGLPFVLRESQGTG